MSSAGFAFDWQFAVVTLAALWGAWAVLRPILRWRATKRAAACAHCASGNPCATEKPEAGPKLVRIGEGRR
jgi:hypothetical protein